MCVYCWCKLNGSQALALARLSFDHSGEHFTAALLVLVKELFAAAPLDPPLAALVRELQRELLGIGAIGNATGFRSARLLAALLDSTLGAGDLADFAAAERSAISVCHGMYVCMVDAH